MKDIKLSYQELKDRLVRLESLLDALSRGEVDLLIGVHEPLLVRFKSLIEENERLLEEAQQKAQDWQTTFDASKSVIWIINNEGRIIQANRTTEAFFNLSHKEIIGKHCWEIVHGTDAPIPECPFQKAKQSLNSESTELNLGNRWMEVTVDPILDRDGSFNRGVHIMTDITERKVAVEKLRQSEAEYRQLSQEFQALLDAVPDSIALIDRGFRIVWANKGTGEALGQKPEELTNKPCHLLWRDLEEPCEHCPAVKSFETGESANCTSTTPDGRIWDLRSVPLRLGDSVVNVINVARDITEHRMIEDQLLQAQKMESIGRLAGGIAHDFNNILNVIIGYGEIVLKQLHSNDPLREKIDLMVKAGERAATLTRQLLVFSRKQALQPEVMNINSVIKDMKDMLIRLIGEDINTEFLLSEKLYNVMADPGQIEQVIMNLVVNARDAMPDGGKLTIKTANEELDKHDAGKYVLEPGVDVTLSITDTGCGMDEETKRRIFEPFFTTKEQEKGTGLGLSTVYGIVKQSGGDIRVYSEPGKGTTFKIFLPKTDAEPTFETVQADMGEHRGSGEHILVVEDEEIIRNLMKDILLSLNYEVTLAAHGGEALLLVEEGGLKPDLVITDVVMPGMNGKVLVDRLRKTCPGLKALYMSGYNETNMVNHDGTDPFTPFIQKPFNISDIAVKVQEVLYKKAE